MIRAFILVTATVAHPGTHAVTADARAQMSRQEMRRTGEMYLPDSTAGREQWTPGVDYSVLLPEPGFGMDGKVEIRELSMYTSSAATREFVNSKLAGLIQKYAGRITYLRQPSAALGMPHARLQTRLFFTMEEVGRKDLHDELDAWIQDPKRWDIYHNIWRPDEKAIYGLNVEFAAKHGIDERAFHTAYFSESVRKRVMRAETDTDRFVVGSNGTPTYVINRRYSVSVQRLAWPHGSSSADLERLLNLIDYLVRSELQTARKAESVPSFQE